MGSLDNGSSGQRPAPFKRQLSRGLTQFSLRGSAFSRSVLAEDGRKRSTVLPPLESEPSFARSPRKANVHHGLLDEESEAYIQKKYKKVSVELDRKIVTHLRRKLAQRLDKRYTHLYDDEERSDEDEDEEGPSPIRRASSKREVDPKKGIFTKYTEIGEKVSEKVNEKGQRTNRPYLYSSPSSRASPFKNVLESVSQVPTPFGHTTNGHGPEVTHVSGRLSRQSDSEDTVSKQFGRATPLPDIKREDSDNQTSVSGKVKRVSLQEPVTLRDNFVDHEEDQDVFLPESTDDMKEADTDEHKSVISFRKMLISPIQTPMVHRPETRESVRLSLEDRRSEILKGYIHRRCPPDHKIVKIYVCSGFTDSNVERTVLMEEVSPRLREYCQHLGHEVQVIDLHWGVKDATTDDHGIPDLCIKSIEDCQKTSLGINFLVIMGEKYGSCILPVEIPVDEFQAIVKAAGEYHALQMLSIKARLAEIEAARSERDAARRQQEGGNADSETVTVSQYAPESHADWVSGRRTESTSSEKHEETEDTGNSNNNNSMFQRRTSIIRKEGLVVRALREEEDDLPDVNTLEQWYILDDNCVPAVYRLQKISSVYKDINKNDGARRQAARSGWATTSKKLQKVLQTFAPEVVSQESRRKYFMSLLELELDHIFGDSDSPNNHIMCIKRTLNGVKGHLNDTKAADYVDINPLTTDSLDTTSYRRIEKLRGEVVPDKLSENAMHEFEIEWSSGGVVQTGRREHQVYLERMCKTVHDSMKRQLAETFGENADVDQKRKGLFEEVSHHVAVCHKRSRKFHGRKDILQLIKSYLRSESPSPLVVHGKTGSGKSAIMSKAAKETHKWLKNVDVRVIMRSIGTTVASTNVRMLLRDLCLQLCEVSCSSPQDVPTDFKGLVNDFAYRISQADENRPYVILLDALDRLTEEHDGRKLAWLPKELPRYVHIVVSTLPDEKYECLNAMKKYLEGKEDCFLEISDLPTGDAMTILEHWLHIDNRNLTDLQFDVLIEAFEKTPTPLFLKMAYSETRLWTSYLDADHTKIQETVKKITTIKFGRLEKDHGEPLVRRALGYITASKNGITSNEMEDILSLDETVMDDVHVQYLPKRRRLPSLLWVRLKLDLSDYIVECLADNMKTLCWSHSQFVDAAEERYLNQRDKAPSYHKALSEYFLGMWVHKPKPYSGNERGAERLVASQDLYHEPVDTKQDGSDRVYNLRKINELPHHLLRSQQMERLKTETLCNFEWVLAKLCGTSLRALLEEYHTVLQIEPTDSDLKTLSDALHLSGNALFKEPRQLASQMIGRLHGIITRDVPKTAADPKKYPYLHSFVSQARNSSLPSLIPSVECLTEPGGILFDLLSGHTDPITAVTLTSDGMRALTTSLDKTMKLWDIRTGRVVKTIEGVGNSVNTIRSAKNDSLAVTAEGKMIRIWSLRAGRCVHVIDEFIDPANITVAGDGRILVGLFDGSNIFRSWDLDTFKQICEKEVPDNGIHKDRSILVAEGSDGDKVLHAFRSANWATAQNARSGKVYHNLKCFEKSSSVVALAFARDYYILACRQQYMTLHEIHQLELFDLKKGHYLRSVRGCVHDNVTELYINLMGSHAIAVCSSEKNSTSDIALWNLETEDHKHLARHAGVSQMGACLDFRFCLTAAKGDRTLRIWNLSGKVNQPAPKLKKSLGVVEIIPMVDNPRYVVAKSVNHGPISVWNVAKAKCLQTAVRIERGLTESSDVVIVRNSQLVILTDRGFQNVSDDSKPVFQTVLIYNLKTKRYENKLTGCYIVPAPSNEYMLLDPERLMGPSDNRSHFMIWSLVTGHVISRIKTNFKELDRKKLELGIAVTDVPKLKRETTAKMTPWDRRAESRSAREHRHQLEIEQEKLHFEELRREKENSIEQFIVSGDEKIIVASFFAHHLCVFDIPSLKHTQTLENHTSMMFLHVSALTFDGSHLVHANYDEDRKISYVTLWDCISGQVKRRLKKETNVFALGITDNAERVVIGKGPNELHIWDPMKSNSLKRIKGYSGLNFGVGSKIFIGDGGSRAIIFAGDISVWDIEKATVMAVFTPDTRIMCCNVALNDSLIAFGLYEKADVIILKLMSKDLKPQIDQTNGLDIFGETTGDTSDEEEEEEREEEERESR